MGDRRLGMERRKGKRRSTGRDRRTSARLPIVASVVQRLSRSVELAQTIDIAIGGMALQRLAEAEPYRPSEVLEIRFQLPGQDEVLQLRVEVTFDQVTGRHRKTGVRFVDLSDDECARIRSYLAASNESLVASAG